MATIRYLKNDYKGGLTNIIAQTRLASSYGLLQILCTTALDEHSYPSSNNNYSPEKLNEVTIGLNYAFKHLKKIFKNNGFNLTKDNNWNSTYKGNSKPKTPKFEKPLSGFEEALKVMYYFWNTGQTRDGIKADYHLDVFNHSQKFFPRRAK